MAIIQFTIADDKIGDITSAMAYYMPPRTAAEKTMSAGAWAKEVLKRWIIIQVKNNRTAIAGQDIQSQTDIDSAIN